MFKQLSLGPIDGFVLIMVGCDVLGLDSLCQLTSPTLSLGGYIPTVVKLASQRPRHISTWDGTNLSLMDMRSIHTTQRRETYTYT